MTGQDLGDKGEQFVLDFLKAQGVNAEIDGPSDIITAEGVLIEVKASNPVQRTDRPSQRFLFCLYREQDGQVKTDHKRADLVVLLAYNGKPDPTVFVIPSLLLGDRKLIALPYDLDRYTGLWSEYKGWDRALAEFE